jgi:chromosome partitioning protein
MLSVLVTNTKGGCGKTTIATTLAGAFANTGLRTVIADCDRQRSSMGWVKRRPSSAPPIGVLNWEKGMPPVPPRTQRLVIDAPAAVRRGRVLELIRMADIVLVPVLPSVFDEDETRRFLDLLDKLKPIRRGKRAVGVVGNRMRGRTKAAERLEIFLEGAGHRAVTRLRDTQLYANAAVAGLSLFDVGVRPPDVHLQDWRQLLLFVDETHAKTVR